LVGGSHGFEHGIQHLSDRGAKFTPRHRGAKFAPRRLWFYWFRFVFFFASW